MHERTRRHPSRPLTFWAAFAGVTLLGLGGAGALWLKAEAQRPLDLYTAPVRTG